MGKIDDNKLKQAALRFQQAREKLQNTQSDISKLKTQTVNLEKKAKQDSLDLKWAELELQAAASGLPIECFGMYSELEEEAKLLRGY